jgi:uncharacterized protein (DUF934 family)
MRRILRRREVIADDWRYLGEEADPSAPGLIISLGEFRTNAIWRDYKGRLGIRLSPADAVEDLAADLERFALVAAEFPGPGEGRGYSQARILRTRLGFEGELRAVGAAVKQDLIFLMERTGFDSYELAPGQSFEAALAALDRYSVAYQPGAAAPAIQQQRFHSPDQN